MAIIPDTKFYKTIRSARRYWEKCPSVLKPCPRLSSSFVLIFYQKLIACPLVIAAPRRGYFDAQPTRIKVNKYPFVERCASSAAEFAQPDVLIGATILAYRYEGLRESDLKTTIRMLKENLHQESGPKKQRPAYRIFENWVNSACKKQKKERNIMDLELFQLADSKQLRKIRELLAFEADVIHYYLRQIVFPKTMQQQRVKITASGQELGSDMLFGRRLGFSGTPSNLLPVDIVPCNFEKGSEGKIIRSLTDDAVTKEAQISLDLMEPEANEWTVRGILDQIAHSTFSVLF